MLNLYNAIGLPLRGAAHILAAWHSRKSERAREWSERLARTLPGVAPGGLWIHGASLGESHLVRSLAGSVRAASPHLPLSVSANTEAGRNGLPAPPAVDAAFFAPLDFAGLPGRVLDAVRPSVLVLVETEIWPNLIHEAHSRSVPVAIVNGRLAPERMSRYLRFSALYGPLLARISCIGAQSEEDAERFAALGIDHSTTRVTGNLKYDLEAPPVNRGELRARFGLDPERAVVVAGSTGEGEDGPVLDAFLEARRSVPGLFLILAPRHLERVPDVLGLAADRGIRLHVLSGGNEDSACDSDGLLVDAMGELAALYGLARAAFVGGSLVPVGGHNVLEPAALEVPVLFGPHTDHVSEPARTLLEAGGGFRVGDARELAREWSRLASDDTARIDAGRSAAAVIETNRGALDRTLKMILDLSGDRSPASTGKERR